MVVFAGHSGGPATSYEWRPGVEVRGAYLVRTEFSMPNVIVTLAKGVGIGTMTLRKAASVST